MIAPHAAGLADKEMVGGICVTRFHYAAEADETLAYTGVMHEQVARGMSGKTRFAQFVRAYLAGGATGGEKNQAAGDPCALVAAGRVCGRDCF